MSEPRVSKVTISLPTRLLKFADEIAEERSVTRIAVIAGLLRKEADAQIEEIMKADTDWQEENK